MSSVRVDLAAFCGGAVVLASVAGAQPSNTTLPGGWSWQAIPGGTYDTGLQGTKRGGFDGQTVGPFNDTSFGIMDESPSAWFDGSDLSAQQYVQRQVFGNFGTSSPPGPSGTRFYNFGYQSTAIGSNFPRTAAEQRSISLNHWNNPFPDAGGVASFGQVVYVPVSATLTSGIGWGADEMLMKFIGGPSGQRSQFFVDATLNASFTSAAFGGISSTGNTIRVNGIVQANNGGPGSYDVAWGYGASNAAQVNLSRSGGIDAVFVEGQFVADPSQGIPTNSVGYSFSKNYNVLSSLVQNGGSFSLTYNSDADINNLVRNSGDADARVSMGPGFEGTARLVVEWQAFRAIPTPGGLALAMGGLLLAARRRRA